jgi:mutual gliding-motility protein MglA
VALINRRARELHLKLVYYGPGLGGKTTNLKVLHDRLPADRRGRLLSIATDHERTLFFDFLPVDLGQVNGYLTRFHLYTVPGQVYYKRSRRVVLQGVDGIVFVADSHPAREHANRDSLADMHEHLAGMLNPHERARLPVVFQYNKRDLAGALPVERLRAALNPDGAPEFEAVASQGRGVNETLRTLCKAVLARLGEPSRAAADAPAAAAAPTPAAPGAHARAMPATGAAPAPPPAARATPAAARGVPRASGSAG